MQDYFFIPGKEGSFFRVDSRTLILAEASSGLSKLTTTEGCFLVSATLQQLEELLPVTSFCRVHRAYIVALAHISSFTADSIRIFDREIPLSKTYTDNFLSRVMIIN